MRDREKQRAWKRRDRDRRMLAKYGPEALGRSMQGRHGRHASGGSNGRWNDSRLHSSQGYVLVRVAKDHPHAFGPPGLRGAYAYEHIVVAMASLGRPLREDEVVHHRNGMRADNRPKNLEVLTRSGHASDHANHPGVRDGLGRFAPGRRHADPAEWLEDLRVREFPEVRG